MPVTIRKHFINAQRPISVSSQRQRGITLVELLIAIALQGLILAILIQLYASSTGVMRYQTELSRIQDAANVVELTISSDIREAGFSGCRNLDELAPTIIAKNFSGYNSLSSSLTIFDDGTGWTAPAGYTHSANTDVITVMHAGRSTYLTGNVDPNNANIQTAENPGVQADDLVLITDCEKSDIFRATSVSGSSGSVTIAHAANNNTSTKLSKAYRENAQVFAFVAATYFIGSDGTDSGLYRQTSDNTPVLIAEDVVDLALSPTTDSEGVITGVQLGFLLETDNYRTNEPVSIQFDGATVNGGSGADRHLRRAYWTFANLRNHSP